jgi:putative membrane protein
MAPARGAFSSFRKLVFKFVTLGIRRGAIVECGAMTARTPAMWTASSDRRGWLAALAAATLGLLLLSGWSPYDRATWLMEVLPVMIALPLLAATHRRFPLTPLLYVLIFVHAGVLMLGGAYTYARVPLGFQLQEWLQLSRNPYYKIGHFFQGFVPALVAREILVRGEHVRGSRMLAFLVVCVVLAISASYEFIEWGAALALGQGADEFLGTQGDPWDTQSDMFFALLGSLAALGLLSGLHDRQLKRARRTPAGGAS